MNWDGPSGAGGACTRCSTRRWRAPTRARCWQRPSAGKACRALRRGRRRQVGRQSWRQRWRHAWPDVALAGVVVTRYGHAVPTRSASPCSRRATRCRTRRASRQRGGCWRQCTGLTADDLVLALMSGGASALLWSCRRRAGRRRQCGRSIARCWRAGATIGEMNVIRKHLSAIKGGRLAAAAAPRARGHARHQRRAGRQTPRHDRERPDRAGCQHLGRRTRARRPLPHETAAGGDRGAGGRFG